MNLETVGLVTVLALPAVGASALALLGRRVVRASGKIAAAVSAAALLVTLALVPALRRGDAPGLAFDWIPSAAIRFALRLDGLSLPFLITQTAVTLCAVIYAWGYHHVDARTSYYYALLLLFALGMSGTVLADSMFLFYVFWELMLVASCVLIAVWGEGARRGAVALKYFIFTHFGSLLVLVALILIYIAHADDGLAALRQGLTLPPPTTRAVIALMLIGFGVKMAVFPLHMWLPDAHTVAPMSVTIMLAATMLSMGAYGVLRYPLGVLYGDLVRRFGVPLMIVGVVSEWYGALMALAERDVKRIIAYSSVSQMGYILFGIGTLTADGVTGATLHVIFHAIVKALLFMCVGLVIRATGRRRIDELGGLGRSLPVVAACTIVGALAIAGAPPLSIFDSEWMIFAGGFETPYTALAVAAVLGSLLTVAYALWFVSRIFAGRRTEEGSPALAPLPRAMIVPTVLLAVLSLVAGVLPRPAFEWTRLALDAVMGAGR